MVAGVGESVGGNRAHYGTEEAVEPCGGLRADEVLSVECCCTNTRRSEGFGEARCPAKLRFAGRRCLSERPDLVGLGAAAMAVPDL